MKLNITNFFFFFAPAMTRNTWVWCIWVCSSKNVVHSVQQTQTSIWQVLGWSNKISGREFNLIVRLVKRACSSSVIKFWEDNMRWEMNSYTQSWLAFHNWDEVLKLLFYLQSCSSEASFMARWFKNSVWSLHAMQRILNHMKKI